MARSKDYWINRTQQLMDSQDKRDGKTTNRLVKEYERTSASIEKDVASYYARFGEDNVIEYRKMVASLSKSERDLLYKNYQEFARKYPDRMNLMPVRESIYELNRLEGLQLSVRQQMLELGAIEQAEFEKVMKTAYERGYLNTMQGLGNTEAFFGVDSRTLELTLNQKWVNDANFSDRIWANKKKMIETMNTEIRDAMIRGEGYAEMQKILRHRMGVGAYEARRLVVTENAFMLEQGKARAFMDEGLERYENSAVRDNKTTEICKNIDGEDFKFSEMKVGENFPPYHAFCRTTIIPLENGGTSAGIRELDAEATHEDLRQNGKQLSDKIRNETDIIERNQEIKSKTEELKRLNAEYKADKFASERTRAITELRYQLDDGIITAAQFNARAEELAQKYSRVDLVKQIRSVKQEITTMKIKHQRENAADIKRILSEVRPMGIGDADIKAHLAGSRSAVAGVIAESYDYLPTDWVKASVAYGKIKPKVVKRGYYRHGSGYSELAVSKDATGRPNFRTTLHELTHRQEHVNPDILKLEKAFYDRRTEGDRLRSLKSVTGGNYKANEKTRVDDFLNPYMGKDYGENAYEVLTMGVDTLYTDPVALMEDEDMYEWVLGMLTVR